VLMRRSVSMCMTLCWAWCVDDIDLTLYVDDIDCVGVLIC
jgi:hypothetical protein